ncbi:MAG TPA: pyrroloquinoline quinone biosynthesis protein PqqE [Myxococcota bacterium]|nr:pyrroloquinoline quinone biosynthesis protein PqqE [Myxococcota bacterium]
MTRAERPYTLVAELTYRCPLRCVYCSNPVQVDRVRPELDASDWRRVLRQAAELGVVQVNLSGGEPLLRDDLEEIVAEARALDLYTNLITSGVPLDRERLAGLKARGLTALQLSFQDVRAPEARRIAGVEVLEQKRAVAGWVAELELPLTLNVVLHRSNIERIDEFVTLAETLGAERLELANTTWLGWALANRAQLVPSRAAIESARAAARAAAERLRGRMELLFVLPDYHTDVPRPCMGGWARSIVLVAPDGLALPCHQARTIAGLRFENVRDQSLAAIWNDSAGFRAFRGEDWMQEPCRSCERRTLDFGGCRCQAFHLTGDAAATDPACRLSPRHALVRAARDAAEQPDAGGELVYRRAPTAP